MDYKLLMPTYRTRQIWVIRTLDRILNGAKILRMINVGCGEGEIDRQLRARSEYLAACDLNGGTSLTRGH